MSNKEARKKRKKKKLANHVEWLNTMHKAGIKLDVNLINSKNIVDKIVSKNAK